MLQRSYHGQHWLGCSSSPQQTGTVGLVGTTMLNRLKCDTMMVACSSSYERIYKVLASRRIKCAVVGLEYTHSYHSTTVGSAAQRPATCQSSVPTLVPAAGNQPDYQHVRHTWIRPASPPSQPQADEVHALIGDLQHLTQAAFHDPSVHDIIKNPSAEVERLSRHENTEQLNVSRYALQEVSSAAGFFPVHAFGRGMVFVNYTI